MTWDCSDAFTVEDEAAGSWTGLVSIPGPLNGWTLALGFSSSVDFLESAAATATGSGVSWELASKDWDAEIPDGQNLSLRFIVIESLYLSSGLWRCDNLDETRMKDKENKNMKLADQVDYSGERPGLTKLDLEGASLCRFTVQCTVITTWKGSLRLQCAVQENP